MKRIVIIVLSLFCASSALATEWNLRLEKEEVLIESRKPEGAKYEEFRASTEVAASVAGALALLQDTDACVKWVFRCKESRTLREPSATERTFYQVTSLPFPAKSRDVIFLAKILYNDDQSVLVSMTAKPEAMKKTKHVRIEEANGFYLLEPLSDSRTRVTWQQYVDPAGALPSWLVNGMLTDLPFESLSAFRELVKQRPYASSVMVYNPEGKPIDIRFEAE
ncbi:MAG: START domain-containing protein [Pseudomonadales bacterium]|nr:START domain-containing protein [Pseudomonadales bacterium]MBO6564725.1 START domain-containing protein [Pseudomonadales bacterium]MBO6597726.1 START domain-containing protein [Pseudomonadales bacterium]MBO6658183.1 START domain-containing protein [Pseudomonadales bacterium]MBO6704041.1 START domain-containing protein [Pseudomonadales bacterium]